MTTVAPLSPVADTARPSRRGFAGMVLVGTALALAGCGRKPGRVIPAEDAGPDAAAYPRTYPVTRLDPPGTVPPSATIIPPAPTDTSTPATPPTLPQTPQQTYPQIIRPQDLQPGGALGTSGTFPARP